MSVLIVTPGAWPYGLRCLDCDARLTEGTAYSKRLVGFNGESPVVEIVCVHCALSVALGDEEER